MVGVIIIDCQQLNAGCERLSSEALFGKDATPCFAIVLQRDSDRINARFFARRGNRT